MGCLDANQVVDFVDGGPAAAPPDVTHHLASCADCRQVVAALARGSVPPLGGEATADAPSAPVERIGRFSIEDVIGRGGMGVVYRAWDPQLERRVALKRVRAGAADAHAEQGRARLVREARALAQLAHPNVVAIHDAGVHDGDVYIAMEHVPGRTLGVWATATPRPSPRAIEAALVGVGRGLAAAHAAGLVHRDVKPDNVIVGDDGRVRVVDFGLVAPVGATAVASGSGDGVVAELATLAAGSPDLTVTGTALGTPAFMSPEQRAGRAADASSDQYSFALTACFALTGMRPERDGDEVRMPRALPPRVRAVLARAVAADPAARWPAMSAAVDALEHAFSPPRARWPYAVAALSALALAGAAYAAWPTRASGDDCAARAGLAGLWDREVGERAAAAVAASGHPDAAEVTRRLLGVVDRHARAWEGQRIALCRDDAAGRGRVEERAARGRCLGRSRAELATFARVVAGGAALDRDGVDAALHAALGFASPEVCADGAARVVAERGARTDPAAVARGERLAEARLLVELSRLDEARALVEQLLRDATAAGDDRDAARARYVEAQTIGLAGQMPETEAPLREAIRLAARAGDDDTVAEAWTTLYVVFGELSRFDEAKALTGVVEAAVARAGEPPRAVLDFLEAHCSVAGWIHEYESAAAHYDRVFAPAAAALGDADLKVIEAAITCAELLIDVDRIPEAEALVARGLASARATLGESSFVFIDASRVTGLVLLARDEPAEARAHFARVAAWADARPGHTYGYYAHYGLAEAWRDEGDLDRAVAEFELARRAAEASVESDYRVSLVLAELGTIAWRRGDLVEADRAWTEAVAIRRRTEGPAEVTARGLSSLGAVVTARGDDRRARALLEESLALFERLGQGSEDDHAAMTGLRLARVLWSVPRERTRALALVRAGERIRRAPDERLPVDGVEVRAWVADVCARHTCPESRAPAPAR